MDGWMDGWMGGWMEGCDDLRWASTVMSRVLSRCSSSDLSQTNHPDNQSITLFSPTQLSSL
jgi:hypothetical protein